MPQRLILVDGTWLAYRSYFAIPPTLATKNGEVTNAVYGFALSIKKSFLQKKPDYGLVVFDSPGKKARHGMYQAYKAGRPPMPSELSLQFALIEELLEAHQIPRLAIPGEEADDVIATYAAMADRMGLETIIVAGDKDLAQLVSPTTRMLDTVKDVTYDEALVKRKWGVSPNQIPDLLALLGDDIDNIPGVPGVGVKTAVSLLERFSSVEGVLENLADLKPKLRQNFSENSEQLGLSKILATARKDLEVPSLDDAKWPGSDDAKVTALYERLEFFSLLGAGAKGAALKSVVYAESERLPEVTPGCVSVALVPLWFAERSLGFQPSKWMIAAEGQHVLWTGECDRLADFLDGLPAQTSIALHDLRAILVMDLSSRLSAVLVARLFRSAERPGILDTRLLSFLVEPTRAVPHRVQQVFREYLKQVLPDKVEDPANMAAVIASSLPELAELLWSRLEPKMRRHYLDVEAPLVNVLAQMERTGVAVNVVELQKLKVEFEQRLVALELNVHELAGASFNIQSTRQLGKVLFEDLKLPITKRTKTGYSTDAEVLERLSKKHPIAARVLEHREVAKLINTYVDVLIVAQEKDGRVHPTTQQTVGASGRLITTDPDLQRTPVRTNTGKRIRRVFEAPPGRVMVSGDWSQIELRVLAHLSGDERLCAAFRDDRDLHRETASLLFGVSPEAVDDYQRNIGKTVNFATIYGQGANALSGITGSSKADAERYIADYFRYYSGVAQFREELVSQAHLNGFVETLSGRRRYIPELSSRSPMDRQAGERIAVNTPIQGSAADLCKLAMVKLSSELEKASVDAKIVLQIHDELLLECAEGDAAAVAEMTRYVMSDFQLAVPLKVRVGVGPTWAEAHD